MKQRQDIPGWLRRRSYPDRIKVLIAAAQRRKPTSGEQRPQDDDRPATSTVIPFPAQAMMRRAG